VLLVDDRRENLLALEVVLDSPEYRLVTATSGADALRHLLRTDFAVVLLDVQMPQMDGFETASLIRQRPRSQATPIIFVTAVFADMRHVGMGYDAGAVDYIIKPFEPAILKSKVRVFADLFRKNLAVQRHAEALFREREERSRLEAERRHQEDLLNRLDHSIIWEADCEDGRFRFVSRQAERLLGYPHRRWLDDGNFFFSCVPAADRERIRAAFDCVRRDGGEQRCQHQLVAADGTASWFHTSIQAEQESSGRAVFRGLSVDITPLKAEAEEIARREAKFRRVVESNMLGHLFGHVDGAISDANDYFLSLTGYSRQELVEGAASFWELTAKDHRHLDEDALAQLRSSGVCVSYEKDVVRRDGRRLPVLVGMALMHGTASEWVCFVLDLTERRRTEAERHRAVRAREELLELVSHDLQNPLGTILMNASLLYRKAHTELDPTSVQKQVMSIQRSAERMKRLIDDLLDLAQVEGGALAIAKRDDDAVHVAAAAVELFQPLAGDKNIRLEIEAPAGPLVVTCDRERILQVLSNILGNAVKFTPEGGVIRLKLTRFDGGVRFSVADTGPGILPEHLPHVFDRHWQANRTEGKGLGLGLFIARMIVEGHGGRIWAESGLGHGTTFHFTVPAPGAMVEPGRGG
jgi:PAS domain S-box-containing protein